jgi:hypothetical protein
MSTAVYEHAFVTPVLRALDQHPFVLIDIGCAWGIDAQWRVFGDNLRALAYDPNLAEVARLNEIEPNPAVKYFAGFAGVPADHPWQAKRADGPQIARNPFQRFSCVKSIVERNAVANDAEKQALNQWHELKLADPNAPIFLAEHFRAEGLAEIDFIKMDIDGADFDVLQSLDREFEERAVLGAFLEVNFIGAGGDTEHSFHNTDQFMRKRGFDLFDLSINRYSSAALPGRYLQANPSKTDVGRPFQGDALYVRDICSEECLPFSAGMTPQRLLKIAAIFSLYGLPDCAAEVLVRFRDRLSAVADVGFLLDVLALQIQRQTSGRLAYLDYMKKFLLEDAYFYPAKSASTDVREDGDPALQAQVERLEAEVARLETALAEKNASAASRLRDFIRRR